MWNASIVRARAAQEWPTIDYQLAPAHGPQIGRTKSSAGTATNENCIELAVVCIVNVVNDRAIERGFQQLVDARSPLVYGKMLFMYVPNIHARNSLPALTHQEG